MGLPSPALVMILPVLFLCSFPIFILATTTTLLAFALLLFRVVIVYIELALAVIPHWISLLFASPSNLPDASPISPVRYSGNFPGIPRRRRRASSVSANGSMSSAPVPPPWMSQPIGPTRDFEGVGGWKLGGDDDDNDMQWLDATPRVELNSGRRHHRRSLTSGSTDALMMNTSRPRTPPGTGFGEAPYPITPIASTKRNGSVHTGSSGSSRSSKSSTTLVMKAR